MIPSTLPLCKVIVIVHMQMHCITCSIGPLWRERLVLWRWFPLLPNLWSLKASWLLPLLPDWPLAEGMREGWEGGEREGDPSIRGDRSAAALPPASCLALFLSRLSTLLPWHPPHTGYGTSTLLLNDLLDDSLLVRHSCSIQTERESGKDRGRGRER